MQELELAATCLKIEQKGTYRRQADKAKSSLCSSVSNEAGADVDIDADAQADRGESFRGSEGSLPATFLGSALVISFEIHYTVSHRI